MTSVTTVPDIICTARYTMLIGVRSVLLCPNWRFRPEPEPEPEPEVVEVVGGGGGGGATETRVCSTGKELVGQRCMAQCPENSARDPSSKKCTCIEQFKKFRLDGARVTWTGPARHPPIEVVATVIHP